MTGGDLSSDSNDRGQGVELYTDCGERDVDGSQQGCLASLLLARRRGVGPFAGARGLRHVQSSMAGKQIVDLPLRAGIAGKRLLLSAATT
jgi:hypothetical protein